MVHTYIIPIALVAAQERIRGLEVMVGFLRAA